MKFDGSNRRWILNFWQLPKDFDFMALIPHQQAPQRICMCQLIVSSCSKKDTTDATEMAPRNRSQVPLLTNILINKITESLLIFWLLHYNQVLATAKKKKAVLNTYIHIPAQDKIRWTNRPSHWSLKKAIMGSYTTCFALTPITKSACA